MKIGVNARPLMKPFTGMGQYVFNLVKELAEIDANNEYVLIVPDKVGAEVESRFPDNVAVKVLSERSLKMAGLRKTWWEQVQVRDFLLKENFDTVWFTYPCNPWTKDFYSSARKKGMKVVLTVHDCIPWMDSRYRKGILSRMYHTQSKRALKFPDIIVTVSEDSKRDIEKLVCNKRGALKTDDCKRVEVIYNSASEMFKETAKEDNGDISNVLEKYGLKRDGYFLYVGGYDVRKNVGNLVKEFEKFRKESSQDVKLVLAGGKLFKSKLYQDFKGEGVVRTGFVSEKELKSLYKGAKAFVNFSKKEGFNIPIVEVAFCGIPIILSDIEVHREIARDKAVFVDVGRVGAGGEGFLKMCEEVERGKWRKRAKELASEYSWKKSAQRFKDVIISK